MAATVNTVSQASSSIDSYQDTPGQHAFDQNYVNRLRQGDSETESHFVHYFGDRLLKRVRSRFRSCEMAEDARQETLLRVLHIIRSKGRIQYPQRLAAFVNGVCENVISEFFRANHRCPQVPEYAPEPFDDAPCAESVVLLRERKAIIQSVLSKLSKNDQLILRKAFLEECDYDQICSDLGMRRNNLRVRIHRALVRFRLAIQSIERKDLGVAASAVKGSSVKNSCSRAYVNGVSGQGSVIPG